MSWKQAAAEIVEMLPHRIHQVMDAYVVATPDRIALVDDKSRLTYRELDRAVTGTLDALRALGIRAGDRRKKPPRTPCVTTRRSRMLDRSTASAFRR